MFFSSYLSSYNSNAIWIFLAFSMYTKRNYNFIYHVAIISGSKILKWICDNCSVWTASKIFVFNQLKKKLLQPFSNGLTARQNLIFDLWNLMTMVKLLYFKEYFPCTIYYSFDVKWALIVAIKNVTNLCNCFIFVDIIMLIDSLYMYICN